MKKTKKITAVICSLAVAGSLMMTSCQNGMMTDDFSQNDTVLELDEDLSVNLDKKKKQPKEEEDLEIETTTKDFTPTAKSELKRMVREGVKEYEDSKPKKWKYESFDGAVTKLTKSGAGFIIEKCGIENPRAKAVINFLGRAAAAGTGYLDNYLNTASCGLYGVAMKILFPEEKKVDPQIQALQDSVNQVQDSIKSLDAKIANLSDTVKSSNDIQSLISRRSSLNKINSEYFDVLQVMNRLNGEELTYKDFLYMKEYITNSDIKTVIDMSNKTSDFFRDYVSAAECGRSYEKMYRCVAENTNAWRYQGNEMIRGFINAELLAGMKIYTVCDALMNPFDGGNVYQDAIVGYLVSTNPEAKKLYEEAVSPVTLHINGKINQKAFDSLMCMVADLTKNADETVLNIIADDMSLAEKRWIKLSGDYTNYVNALNAIAVTDDAEGQVTCLIPGARYTFSTTAGTRKVGNVLNGSSKPKSASDWKNIYTGGVDLPTADVYDAILSFYKDNGLTVTDGQFITEAGIVHKATGDAKEVTLENILKYDARVTGFKGDILYLNKDNKDTGFKLNHLSNGYIWEVGIHEGECKAFYLVEKDGKLNRNEKTILSSYSYDKDDIKKADDYKYSSDSKVETSWSSCYLVPETCKNK